MTCTKKIKNVEYGLTETWICGKEAMIEVKSGMYLCNKHFAAYTRNNTPWGERKGYVPTTQSQMDNGVYMRLKGTNSKLSYFLRKGIIHSINGYSIVAQTDLPADIDLFVTKIQLK